MDILAALGDTPSQVGNLRCRIGKWLDAIPDDQPGKADLIATLEEQHHESPHWRTQEQLDAILLSLGLHSSGKTIGNHRARRCRCWI